MERISPWKQVNNTPVVLSTNSEYLPYTAVALQSVLDCGDKEMNYDIFVLYRDVTKEDLSLLFQVTHPFENAHLRTIDVSEALSGFQKRFRAGNKTIIRSGEEPAFSCLIPDLFAESFEKVICLGSDVIVRKDPAALLKTDLHGYPIGAVPDFNKAADTVFGVSRVEKKTSLRMINPGVLVFQFSGEKTGKKQKDRKAGTHWFWGKPGKEPAVYRLPSRWNVIENQGLLYRLPEKEKEEWIRSTRDAAILHYDGKRKPWQGSCAYEEAFWKAAARCIAFPEIVQRMVLPNQRYSEPEKELFIRDTESAKTILQANDRLCSYQGVMSCLSNLYGKRNNKSYDDPLISVIIPVYNAGEYLEECVDSIIHQTYTKLEIILVDDGSTDGSSDLCDDYAKSDSRIIVIHKENGGLSSARNAGLDHATGDYIGWIDADDWAAPDAYEYLAEGVRKYHAPITVCGWILSEGRNNRGRRRAQDEVLTAGRALEKLVSEGIRNYTWDKIYERRLYDNIRYQEGFLFEDIREAYKLIEKAQWISLLKWNKFYHRVLDESISHKMSIENKTQSVEAHIQRYRDLVRRWPELREATLKRLYRSVKTLKRAVVEDSRENYQRNRLQMTELMPFLKEERDHISTACHFGIIDKCSYQLLLTDNRFGYYASFFLDRQLRRKSVIRKKLARKKAQLKEKLIIFNQSVPISGRCFNETKPENGSAPATGDKDGQKKGNRILFVHEKPDENAPETKRQSGGAVLLKALKTICEESGLVFWLQGDSLPDTADEIPDAGMMREDIEKLFSAISHYPNYRIDYYYNVFGPDRVIRMSPNESGVPVFLNILSFDYAGNHSYTEASLREKIEETREEMRECLRNMSEKLMIQYCDQIIEDPYTKDMISKAYERYIQRLPETTSRRYIYRSIDSLYREQEQLIPYDTVFPLAQSAYAGEMYPVPKDLKQQQKPTACQ